MSSLKTKHVLFRHQNFLNLFLGRFISAIGDKVFTIALAVWVVTSNNQDAKLHLGLLLAMNTIPIVLFGPLAGTLADRFDRKVCMLFADASRFLTLFLTLILLVTGNLTITYMYFISFVLAMFVPLFESSANASIASLVTQDDLAKAVATDGSVLSMSQIIGASLGGLLVATIHFEGALIFNALTFALSFFFVRRIRIKLLTQQSNSTSYFSEIIKGLHFVFDNKALKWLLFIFGFVNFFTAAIFILIPFLVKFHFNLPAAQWIGLYEVSFALGAGITTIGFSFIKSHKKIYIKMTSALILFGIGFILTGNTSYAWIVCFFLFASGVGLAIINTLALVLFQHSIQEEMKGRFFAILGSVALSAIPLSYIITGYISSFISASSLFCIYGAMIILIAFSLAFIPRLENEIN
jgi:MFS transporter, DHA3 family, macrolide efflux protein